MVLTKEQQDKLGIEASDNRNQSDSTARFINK